MDSVLRFDALGRLDAPAKLDNGWLRAPANLTRTGVFEYRRADGSIRRELRPPDEVFAPDALTSFAMVPLTNEHPVEGRLDAVNTKTAAVIGHVGDELARDGDFVRGRILVTDGAAVAQIESKQKLQLSCGYTCDVEESSGVYNGIPYDCIQRNIRGNHVALVKYGRAGPDVRVRLDKADAIAVHAELGAIDTPQEAMMLKIKLDGIDCEVTEQAFQLIGRELAKRDAEIAEAKKTAETATARADAAAAEVTKATEALKAATDPATLRSTIQARVALERQAAGVLGTETKFDEMDDLAIKAAVVKKLSPDAVLDGKSSDYVSARFDAALELAGRQALADARRAVDEVKTDAADPKAPPRTRDEARERFNQAIDNAFRRNH